MNFLIYAGLFVLLIVGIMIEIHPEKIYKYDIGNDRNISSTFCQEYEKYQQNKGQTGLTFQHFQETHFINRMSCTWMKKERVFWMWADGLGYDQIQRIIEQTEGQGSTHYGIISPVEKASGLIHDTYMTGQFSTNMEGNQIDYDNIFRQMKKGHTEPFYIGKAFPMVKLVPHDFASSEVDHKMDSHLFDKFCHNYNTNPTEHDYDKFNRTDSEWAKYADTNWIGWSKEEMDPIIEKKLKPFTSKLTDEWMEKCISRQTFNKKNIKYEMVSPIYYTSIPDHYSHFWGKYSLETYFYVYRQQEMILSLIKMLRNKHPKMAFVLSSDHGGQKFVGEDVVAVHGFNTDDNLGAFYVNSDFLSGNRQNTDMKTIDSTDFASTTSQMFMNTNIPLLSQGTPKSIFNDNFNKLMVAFAHFNQLRQFATLLKDYGYTNQEKFNKDVNNIKENLLKYNEQISKQVSLSEFFDEDGASIVNDDNIAKLNSIDIKDLLKDLEQLNQSLRQDILSFRTTHKRQWAFVLLILAVLSILVIFIWSNKRIVLQLQNAYSADSVKEKAIWILGGILMFTDALFVFFIVYTEDMFLVYSNYAYFILKVAILILLPNQEPQEDSLLQKHQGFHNVSTDNESNPYDYPTKKPDEAGGIQAFEIENNSSSESAGQNQSEEDSPFEVKLIKKFIVNNCRKIIPKINRFKLVIFISILINIISFILTATDYFINMKLHSEVFNKHYIVLNLFIYVVFYLVMVYDSNGVLYNKQDGVERSNLEKQIDIWLYRIWVVLMAYYDCDQHDQSKTIQEFYINSLIQYSMAYMTIYKLYSVIVPNDPLKVGQYQHNLMGVSKILVVSFIFYLGDMSDKIFNLIFVIPTMNMFLYIVKSSKTSTKAKYLSIFCLVREAAVFYMLMKGSFEFGYNRSAANKILARIMSQTPKFSAALQGVSKIQQYEIIFCGIFSIMYLRKTEKNNIVFDGFGRLVEFALIVKILFINLAEYILLIISQGEGFFFRWVNMYFVGHVAIMMCLFGSGFALQIRHIFCLKNQKYRLPLHFKKLLIISIFVIHLGYFWATQPYFD